MSSSREMSEHVSAHAQRAGFDFFLFCYLIKKKYIYIVFYFSARREFDSRATTGYVPVRMPESRRREGGGARRVRAARTEREFSLSLAAKERGVCVHSEEHRVGRRMREGDIYAREIRGEREEKETVISRLVRTCPRLVGPSLSLSLAGHSRNIPSVIGRLTPRSLQVRGLPSVPGTHSLSLSFSGYPTFRRSSVLRRTGQAQTV